MNPSKVIDAVREHIAGILKPEYIKRTYGNTDSDFAAGRLAALEEIDRLLIALSLTLEDP